MDVFHRDKFGDMEISSWRFSYRYFLNMKILMEIFIGDIGDMEKNYYFLFEMFKR